MNKLIVSLTFFLVLLGDFAVASENEKNWFFGVDLTVQHVGVDLRLNDIPVYFDDMKGELKVEVPVPDSVLDGKNRLSVMPIIPFTDTTATEKEKEFDENAEISAVFFRQSDNGRGEKETLGSVKLVYGGDQFKVVSSEKANVKLGQNNKQSFVYFDVDVDSPFPRWQWQDGQVIDDTSDNYQSLLNAYKEVYSAFEKKDLKKLFKLYEQRAKEISVAYNLNGVRDGHEKLSTGKDLEDPKLELFDFYEKEMFLDVMANGRLARIKNPDHRQPVIFLDKEARLVHTYKFMFYKNLHGEWVMIR